MREIKQDGYEYHVRAIPIHPIIDPDARVVEHFSIEKENEKSKKEAKTIPKEEKEKSIDRQKESYNKANQGYQKEHRGKFSITRLLQSFFVCK